MQILYIVEHTFALTSPLFACNQKTYTEIFIHEINLDAKYLVTLKTFERRIQFAQRELLPCGIASRMFAGSKEIFKSAN